MVLTTRRQARLQEQGGDGKTIEGSVVAVTARTQGDRSPSASSSSSAESDNESESEEDTDSEYSSQGEQDLEELFQTSLKACRAKDEAALQGINRSVFETNADEVHFGEVENGREASKDERDTSNTAADTKGKG